MFEPRFRALTTASPRSRVRLALAVAAFVAVAACEPVASPASTGAAASPASAPPLTAAPQQSVTVVAPVPTPDTGRPAGVPANAQPLMFGCTDGLARCTDIAPGTYYTAGEWALLPGLTFTLPAGWASLANEAGELELHRNGDDHNELMFWRDLLPWVDGHPDLEAPAGPEAWIARLKENPCVEVSDSERGLLGDWIDLRGGKQADLEAISVSVDVAAEAAYVLAGCPETGQVVIMSDPMHWESGLTIGGDEMNDPGCPCKSLQWLSFASIGYASHKHLLVAAIQSYGPKGEVDAALARFRADAQPILDSLIAPAIVVDN